MILACFKVAGLSLHFLWTESVVSHCVSCSSVSLLEVTLFFTVVVLSHCFVCCVSLFVCFLAVQLFHILWCLQSLAVVPDDSLSSLHSCSRQLCIISLNYHLKKRSSWTLVCVFFADASLTLHEENENVRVCGVERLSQSQPRC